MNCLRLVLAALLSTFSASPAKSEAGVDDYSQAGEFLYVFHDKGSHQSGVKNHFVPSAWGGDYGDLRFDDSYSIDPVAGLNSIKITYTAKGTQGANWVGITWVVDKGCWSNHYANISTYNRITFWAKATRPDGKPVVIDEFAVGTATGEDASSSASSMGATKIKRRWKQYAINLSGKDLSKMSNMFSWRASRDRNPAGFELNLDEIRFER